LSVPLLHINSGSREPLDSFYAFWGEWVLVSPVTVVLALVLGAYLFGLYRLNSRAAEASISGWRITMTLLGFAALTFSLVGPPDALAEDMFFLHMMQHLLLTLVAAPLLLAASPVAAYLWSLPVGVRHAVARCPCHGVARPAGSCGS